MTKLIFRQYERTRWQDYIITKNSWRHSPNHIIHQNSAYNLMTSRRLHVGRVFCDSRVIEDAFEDFRIVAIFPQIIFLCIVLTFFFSE